MPEQCRAIAIVALEGTLFIIDRFFKTIPWSGEIARDRFFVSWKTTIVSSYALVPVEWTSIALVLNMIVLVALFSVLVRSLWQARLRERGALMMVAVGGLSNVIDRGLFGGAVDYWVVGTQTNFFTTNLADGMVVIGVALLIRSGSWLMVQ